MEITYKNCNICPRGCGVDRDASVGICRSGAKAKIKTLSGGNQQKVIIARWLLKNSDIFIFDEPFNGIDKENIIKDYIEQLVFSRKDYQLLLL